MQGAIEVHPCHLSIFHRRAHPPRSYVHKICPPKATNEATSYMPEPSGYQAVPPAAHNDIDNSTKTLANATIDEASGSARTSRNPFKQWRWEIFTYLLGTSAFVAILVILLSAQHKPPESWVLASEYEVEITAIVAALAQVAQSAFLVPISYCIGQLKWCITHPYDYH
jgi:hypothetical protein